MMGRSWYRVVRGASPLSCLSGVGLLIMASDRLAHAITTLCALIWVYCLSALAAHAAARAFPQRGRPALLAFLSSFVACVFALLLWIISPLCVLEMFFVVALVPVICMASGVLQRFEAQELRERCFNTLSEALLLGLLIVIFALIREPLGFASLSLPGGAQGSVLLSFREESFLPVRLIASSSGALLLLGYFLALYRYYREKK